MIADGGFTIAGVGYRRHGQQRDEHQVHVFDALGRCTRAFRVGETVDHLVADEAGALWGGHRTGAALDGGGGPGDAPVEPTGPAPLEQHRGTAVGVRPGAGRTGSPPAHVRS
ncbi:hypothetical protein [Streptomyces bullii]|uniref:Uncharacterized protein n=1 Tax=Streptomyces bullii TaxID=349910 RepID=A0ABW0UT57_9ACTN